MTITIPCDYKHPEGTFCENGKVLIYGEMGGRLPETIICPRCGGTEKIEVERSEIEEEIKDLKAEVTKLYSEIERLQSYLK